MVDSGDGWSTWRTQPYRKVRPLTPADAVQGVSIGWLVVSALGAIVSGAVGAELVRWWRGRSTDAAEVEYKQATTGDVVADTLQKVIDALNAEITRQSTTVKSHERRIVALEVENRDEKDRHKLTESRVAAERQEARRAVLAYEECERHREEDRERMAHLEQQIAQIQENQKP